MGLQPGDIRKIEITDVAPVTNPGDLDLAVVQGVAWIWTEVSGTFFAQPVKLVDADPGAMTAFFALSNAARLAAVITGVYP